MHEARPAFEMGCRSLIVTQGPRDGDLLKQAADKVTSICEWIIYAIRGEDHGTSNV